MNYRCLIPFLLASLLITNSSGGTLIYWTYEFHVGDTFDMVLVDLELNGPESTHAHFPGTNYLATPDDIGLIITNEIKELWVCNPCGLSNTNDRLYLNQSSTGVSADFEYSVESRFSYRPPYVRRIYYSETPNLRPSFVIYNDWNWQKNQVTHNWNVDSGATVLNISWKETIDIFTISYEVNLLGRFDHQKKHVEKVEEAYFKNTGIMAYFNLFVDSIQDEDPVQYEILIANTQCDIDECKSRRGFLETSLNNTKSDSDNQFLPSFSTDIPTEVLAAIILSISLALGVLILSKKYQ